MLRGVSSENVRDRWPLCAIWLDKAMARTNGLMTPETVIARCQDYDSQLWEIVDDGDVVGAVVTEVRNLPNGEKSVHVLAEGAKDGNQSLSHQPDLINWARSTGATRLTMDGRLGQMRRLKGWRFLSVMMEKSIV